MPIDLNGNIVSSTSINGSAFSNTIVTDGIICHLDAANKNSYPGSGTTWTDLTNNGNNFTLNNTSFNSGNGGYIVLNGTNAYASISNLSLNSGFTLEIWAYMNNAGSFGLFGQGTATNNNGLHILYTTDTRGMIFGMYANDNDYQENYRPSTGNWYNWVFTYNGSSYEKRFYANGDLIKPGASVQNIYSGTGQFNIGAIYGSATSPANGRVGAVRIYNRVLNTAEILANYYGQKSRFGL